MEPTKENLRFCNRQIERLQGLHFFDTLSQAAIQELTKALLLADQNQAQAEMFISGWLAEHSEYPTPADIYQAARELTRNTNPALPEPCELCNEIPGYIRIEQEIKTGVFAGETRSALALCSCPRGKALGEAALKART